jgi:hypothetical protein
LLHGMHRNHGTKQNKDSDIERVNQKRNNFRERPDLGTTVGRLDIAGCPRASLKVVAWRWGRCSSYWAWD